jgi:Secretion system C-terminal sorting domain
MNHKSQLIKASFLSMFLLVQSLGASYAQCAAESQILLNTSTITATAGSNSLASIPLNAYLPTAITSFAGTLNISDPTQSLVYTNNGTCTSGGNRVYDKYSFRVLTAGSYTFTNSSSSPSVVLNMYSGLSYQGCDRWLKSSANNCPSGICTSSLTISLSPGVYTLTVGGLTAIALGNYAINVSGGSVYTALTGNSPGGYSNWYLVYNTDTDKIIDFPIGIRPFDGSTSASLDNATNYPQGKYRIYGIHRSQIVSIFTYRGTSFSAFQTLINNGTLCAKLSTNSRDVIISCASPTPTITSITPTLPSCSAATGGIVVVATDATGYSKNNGETWQSSNNFTGLSAGNYNIKVRSAVGGCEASQSVSLVAADAPPAPNLVATPNNIINGNSSILSATGCSGTVTWLTNPTQIGNSISVSPTTNTTYKATCTVNNCQSSAAEATVTVSSPCTGAPNPNTTAVTVSMCKNSEGSVVFPSISCNAGSSLKFYNPANEVIPFLPQRIETSVAGTHVYRASCSCNALGIESEKVPILTATIRGEGPTSARLEAGAITTFCQSAAAQLKINITGGTAPYSYELDPGTTGSGYQSGAVLGVRPEVTTSYTLKKITDANGCSTSNVSGSALIIVAPAGPSAAVLSASGATTVCGLLPISLSVSITGGVSPYKIVHSAGTINNYQNGTIFQVQPTAAGNNTFSLTSVTDANGCPATVSGNVNTNSIIATAPTLSASPQTINRGSSSTLTATGCDGGTITWLTEPTQTGNTIVVSPTQNTTYKAFCTIGSCKSAEASVAVDIQECATIPPPVLAASPSTISKGQNSTLTATGCNNGTITWLTTPIQNTATIQVSPEQNTVYKAICTINSCKSNESEVKVLVSAGCVVNKVRLKFRMDCCANRLVGATIQGSNNGADWLTIYTINANGTGDWQEFSFGNTTAYNQIRFVAGPSGFGELYEIGFYNNSSQLTGTTFGSAGSNAYNGSEKAIDGLDTGDWWHGNNETPGNANYVGLILTGCNIVSPPTPTPPTPTTPRVVCSEIRSDIGNATEVGIYAINVASAGTYTIKISYTSWERASGVTAMISANADAARSLNLTATPNQQTYQEATISLPLVAGNNTIRFSWGDGFYRVQKVCAETTNTLRLSQSSELNPTTTQNSLMAYPNPATDIIHTNYILNSAGQVELNLYDMMGLLRVNRRAAGRKGENDTSLDIKHLPSGMYLLKLQTVEGSKTHKVMITR